MTKSEFATTGADTDAATLPAGRPAAEASAAAAAPPKDEAKAGEATVAVRFCSSACEGTLPTLTSRVTATPEPLAPSARRAGGSRTTAPVAVSVTAATETVAEGGSASCASALAATDLRKPGSAAMAAGARPDPLRVQLNCTRTSGTLVALGVTLREAVAEDEGVGESDALGVADGVGVNVGVGEGLTVALAALESDAAGVEEGVGDSEAPLVVLGVGVGDALALALGLAGAEGEGAGAQASAALSTGPAGAAPPAAPPLADHDQSTALRARSSGAPTRPAAQLTE